MKMIRLVGIGLLLLSLTGCALGNPYIKSAEDDVKSNLNFPDTAKFADVQVSQTQGSYMRVTGHVKSENGFGVPSTSSFTCEVLKMSDGTYSVLNDDVVDGTDIPSDGY